MEATKKTSTSKAALLVVAALSMLLSGLFIATAQRSDANPPPACPDGFSLTADAKNCFQTAVVTSADNPNSCDEGTLTPDGTKCYVPAQILPQEGATLCPKGYSPDDSLGGMCARFEAALQRDASCPEGARGVAGACYILVAKGPRGATVCDTGQVLAGTNCVVTGTPPVNGVSSCPVSATVIQDGVECYTLVSKQAVPIVCAATAAGYNAAPYAIIDGICKYVPANAGANEPVGGYQCPSVTIGTSTIRGVHQGIDMGSHMKIGVCTLSGAGVGACPDGTTPDTNGVDCRRPVDLVPGAKVCAAGFGLVDGKCIRYESPATPAPQCPTGSVEDSVGDCRKPVANAAGEYYCASADAALNGKSCVYTTGFLIDPAPNLYKCAAGTRTVIGGLLSLANTGDGTNPLVICILGNANANTTTGPSCLQGVLSTDNAYCIVPRIDTAPAAAVAAPVPAFTG